MMTVQTKCPVSGYTDQHIYHEEADLFYVRWGNTGLSGVCKETVDNAGKADKTSPA